MTKKRPTEAEVNYRFVGSATKSIHRSVKQASNDLQDDYRRILRTYTEKGGFASQKEALEYMNGHVQPEGYKALVDRARKLPEPQRTQELTRLSTDAYKFRMSRAKACDIAQGYHARILREDIRKDLGKAKAETAITASEQALFNAQKAAGTGIGFDLPNTGQIKQIAYGTETEKKIKLFSDNEMKGIREVMDAGILSGRTYDDVAKQCDQYTDKEFYKVRRLVRTEMAQASVDAELAEMEELGVEECEVHCTLDEKTCEICGQYDGKVYKVSDTAHLPTYHPNCRCYVTVVLKKEGKTRSARNEKGKSIKVPASMTYQEWKKQYGSKLEIDHVKFNLGDAPSDTALLKTAQKIPKDGFRGPEVIKDPKPPKDIGGSDKGVEIPITEAIKTDVNPTGSMDNCTFDVLAIEANCQGYQVEAIQFDPNNPLHVAVSMDPALVLRRKSNGKHPNYMQTPKSSSLPGFIGWLDDIIEEGRRYTIDLFNVKKKSQHIMTLYKDKDGIVLYDGQIKKEYRGLEIERRLKNVSLKGRNRPTILRTDDTVFDKTIADKIMRGHKRNGH